MLRRLTLAGIAALVAAGLLANPAAAAPGTGWLTSGTPPRCSDIRADSYAYYPCLLAIGPAVQRPTVVTAIEGQGIAPTDLFVITPTSPGRWSGRAAVPEGAPWQEAPGAFLERNRATAIRMAPGERLIIDDPAAASMGINATEGFSSSFGGPTIDVMDYGFAKVRPSVMAWFEPDADGDGWGDDSQDSCPGVEGLRCASAAAPTVALTVPKYVPSVERPTASWQVSNAGATPQPFVLTLHTSVPSAVTAPPGTDCARRAAPPIRPVDLTTPPGAYDVSIARPMPRSILADLTDATPPFEPRPVNAHGYPASGQLTVCLLPALAPGAVASGAIAGGDGNTIAGEARYTAKVAALYGGAVVQTTASSVHHSAGKPLVAFKPGAITAGTVDRRGRLRVRTSCNGPALKPGCRLTVVVRSRVGARRLGASTAPVVVAGDGAGATLKVKLSGRGLRWLRSHRRSQVSVTVTAVRPGESTTQRTISLRPRLSKALRRALR